MISEIDTSSVVDETESTNILNREKIHSCIMSIVYNVYRVRQNKISNAKIAI